MPDSKPLATRPIPVKSIQVTVSYIGGTDGVAGRFPSGKFYECDKGSSIVIDKEDYESLAPSEWTLQESSTNPSNSKENK